ncbi:SARP family transcriptional regulator [Actinoplanes ianthinogenes]|uniref:SARP family transcriptional regulator n=1 Tax=Actinoplanes ianthinogenes TaxID=122358 RepID=A0ABM7M8P2_9ACTN|nr:AfsR/SARP family transcriptional regulator [Actinoplanes ianthinogenes]BCJ47996.1 SARP family transcriptional regulator [Actinoplanes ianthinogenes]GGR05661.1 SARP family transcriptional regulator [Actinoplanes ianthinogenes]
MKDVNVTNMGMGRDGGEVIKIELLGSLRVRRKRDLTPSAPKLRRVLAALVLNANLVVSVEQLAEELWEDSPPASAQTTMQTYIYQLRRRLGLAEEQSRPAYPGHAEEATAPVLLTRVGGYELRLGDDAWVDVHDFDRAVSRGRALLDSGRLAEAVESFGAGLALWRGPALVDVTVGRQLSVWATELEERRKTTIERRFGALLQMGQHHAIVDELAGVAGTYPTHEGFARQLMLALHRCGRRAEGLDAFRRLRSRLVEDLGVEPSAALHRLHQGILADDPKLYATPHAAPAEQAAPVVRPCPAPAAVTTRTVTAPAQLPPGIPDFVGRAEELSLVERVLTDSRPSDAGARIVEVHGPPGIGKTTFAVRAAHRVREHFPDGQLFIDASGLTSGDVRMADVLTATLRSCGLPRETLPESVADLSRTLRSWTGDRRVLLVIDDVLSAELLKPLLPGSSGCAVVCTNRYRHEGLAGAHRVTLPAPTLDEGMRLFAGIAGSWRIEDEGDVVEELLTMCDLLPLVVRGVATRLSTRPGWSAGRLRDRLRVDESMFLDLAAGPANLVGSIALSYRNLPDAHRRVLQLMATGRPAGWTPRVVADELGESPEAAEIILEHLVDMNLAEETPSATTPSHRALAPLPEYRYRLPRLTALALRSITRAEESGLYTPAVPLPSPHRFHWSPFSLPAGNPA